MQMFSLRNAFVECGKSIDSQQKKSFLPLNWWKSEVLLTNMEHTGEKLFELKGKVGDMIENAGEKVRAFFAVFLVCGTAN